MRCFIETFTLLAVRVRHRWNMHWNLTQLWCLDQFIFCIKVDSMQKRCLIMWKTYFSHTQHRLCFSLHFYSSSICSPFFRLLFVWYYMSSLLMYNLVYFIMNDKELTWQFYLIYFSNFEFMFLTNSVILYYRSPFTKSLHLGTIYSFRRHTQLECRKQ